MAAVDACRWTTKSIPYAPYVTSLPWISHYGCQYVVHGDDISSDSGGEDCYRYVKAAGRFLVVKRTPGISTTDLVGRMLLCTKNHFIKSLPKILTGEEGSGSLEERKRLGEEMTRRIKEYATDETGLQPGPQVLSWAASEADIEDHATAEAGTYRTMAKGKAPRQGQRIVYVDGGFDLFSSGHIEFLRQVALVEEAIGHQSGWYKDSNKDHRPAYIVVGVHDDEVINHWKGVNYPIMNIFERGLCVLQCRVSMFECCFETIKLTTGSTLTPSSFRPHSQLVKSTSLTSHMVFPMQSIMVPHHSSPLRMILTSVPKHWVYIIRSGITTSRM